MIGQPVTLLLLAGLLAAAPLAWPGSAKVLLYHHVSSETPASTSVTPAVFESHLELLQSSGYQVVTLQKIVDTLVNGGEFDSKWVAITFDDAYRSVLTEAAPRLEQRGWPFTIFTSTDFIDKGYDLYLSWDELRELESRGTTIANHNLTHEHMVRRHSGESVDDWLNRLGVEVMEAQEKLEAELEDPLRLFAYPYGEFSAELANLMQSLGFIAFSQQSGPIGTTTSLYAIPRFPLGTGFDSVSSLAEKLRTEHLPLANPPVPATLLDRGAPAPALTLRITDAVVRPGSMNCFVAGQPNAEVHWQSDLEFQVIAQQPLRSGRSKYTCTAPYPDKAGAYYWHTHLFIKPRADGSWYDG